MFFLAKKDFWVEKIFFYFSKMLIYGRMYKKGGNPLIPQKTKNPKNQKTKQLLLPSRTTHQTPPLPTPSPSPSPSSQPSRHRDTRRPQAFFRPTDDARRRRSNQDATTSAGAGVVPPTARAVLARGSGVVRPACPNHCTPPL